MIKKLPLNLARSIMRELLRFDGIQFGEVDKIAKLIPRDASLLRICGNVSINKLPEGKELVSIVKQYKKLFNLGCKIEQVFDYYNKN